MKKTKLKVITIVGTRPEVIRLSRVTSLLDKFVNHKLVHTGQNYDYELNKIFYEELKLRLPDYELNINTTSLGNILGDTLIKVEEVLIKEKPDAVLILGDTNASISAIITKRYKIPIYHMEAGNRSFDFQVPEEINRRIIDHIADFNLVYTENSRRHLIAEGLPQRRIYLTGSPMKEVISYYDMLIKKSKILKSLKLNEKKYFLLSIHREENVDNEYRLRNLISIMEKIIRYYDMPLIISTHPRTKKRLNSLKDLKKNKNFIFHKPFGFFDYINLQKKSFCTLSDSGTISEEASILNFPAVTIRNSIERPEALDAGSIILTGMDENITLDAIKIAVEEQENNWIKSIPEEYKIMDTSKRVLKLIISTCKLSNDWWGVYKN